MFLFFLLRSLYLGECIRSFSSCFPPTTSHLVVFFFFLGWWFSFCDPTNFHSSVTSAWSSYRSHMVLSWSTSHCWWDLRAKPCEDCNLWAFFFCIFAINWAIKPLTCKAYSAQLTPGWCQWGKIPKRMELSLTQEKNKMKKGGYSLAHVLTDV